MNETEIANMVETEEPFSEEESTEVNSDEKSPMDLYKNGSRCNFEGSLLSRIVEEHKTGPELFEHEKDGVFIFNGAMDKTTRWRLKRHPHSKVRIRSLDSLNEMGSNSEDTSLLSEKKSDLDTFETFVEYCNRNHIRWQHHPLPDNDTRASNMGHKPGR